MNIICDHRPKKIVAIDGVSYYCADKNGVLSFKDGIVFNFTGIRNIPDAALVPQELVEHIDSAYEEVVIAWPDFNTPKVKATFWQALHKYVLSKSASSVCLHCAGGHGRTGTAMAAIMISLLKMPFPKAVDTLRANYCEMAVETHEQCDYLYELDFELNERICATKDVPKPACELVRERLMSEKKTESVLQKYFSR